MSRKERTKTARRILAGSFSWARRHKLARNVSAEIVGAELERLRKAYRGKLTPKIIVDAARPIRSPLHPLFEWDDTVAGEKFRIGQARFVMASIRFESPDFPLKGPQFLYASVTHGKHRHYVTMADAMSDADTREQVLEEAREMILAWKRRYGHLEEFAEVVSVIARTVRSRDRSTEHASV